MSGTAEVHQATLQPTKLELLQTWLPSQPWFEGDASDLERIASYRFVDPAGEVGVETTLVRSGGAVYQVPLTYRPAPLDDEAAVLIGTMEHSVLGTRWCYAATSDPVYTEELLRVIREGDTEAEVVRSGETEPLPKSMRVEGSGTALVANAASQTLRIARRLDAEHALDTKRAIGLLTGFWELDGQPQETVLAVLR